VVERTVAAAAAMVAQVVAVISGVAVAYQPYRPSRNVSIHVANVIRVGVRVCIVEFYAHGLRTRHSHVPIAPVGIRHLVRLNDKLHFALISFI
jgi:hypothetical protein